ncbi:MAG: hypothetical protein J1F42_14395 [Lachnospiraceae bacterium]|nr:hypothetical protein [Lachnospiraceae bacterium]
MKYYMLEQDKSYANLPQLQNWYQNIDERDVHMGRYSRLPKKTMLYIRPDKNVLFPDILLYPFLMVGEKVKERLLKYEPNMQFCVVFLVDKENKGFQYYSVPFIKEIDCISDRSEFNRDRSVVHRLVLDGKKIPKERPLFLLQGLNTRCVVARMDFVESILRKEIYGIQLVEAQVENRYQI